MMIVQMVPCEIARAKVSGRGGMLERSVGIRGKSRLTKKGSNPTCLPESGLTVTVCKKVAVATWSRPYYTILYYLLLP